MKLQIQVTIETRRHEDAITDLAAPRLTRIQPIEYIAAYKGRSIPMAVPRCFAIVFQWASWEVYFEVRRSFG